MDKKEIYEHLAKIYLDASSKKKKKFTVSLPLFKSPFFIIAFFIFTLAVILSLLIMNKNKSLNSQIALVLQHDVVKINFHFDPAKKEIYSLGLNKLDLTKFRALAFSAKAKKDNYKDTVALRVEFTSEFKERAEIYFKDISTKWQDYKINLSDFKNISDWSNIRSLAFIVEEWNAKEKNGLVYIDNISLLR